MTDGEKTAPWLVCQLGAREHYAMARALRSEGRLAALITDAWVPPGSPFGRLKRSLRERFHVELEGVDVRSANSRLLIFQLFARLRGLRGWDLTMTRNQWFQRQALRALQNLENGRRKTGISNSQLTVFAYSYAALDLFRWAKVRGWRTVLGQIDPGRTEERIVARLYDESPEQSGQWESAPAEYWEDWSEECRLADRIVVNSNWSRRALVDEGIAREKIAVVPLAYEAPVATAGFRRCYPTEFSEARPLRVLFLGQVNLRKGVGPLFESIQLLRAEPIEFWFVGPMQLRVQDELRDNSRVRWIGAVPRGQAADYYRDADVFMFSTCSDGFGLTQLEAQAWKLPLIASQFCGDVVRNGVNGFILPEVSGKAIAAMLSECLREPQILSRFSKASINGGEFNIERLGQRLLSLL